MAERRYYVPKVLLPEMMARIAAVNARGQRLGCSPWQVSAVRETRVAVLDEAGFKTGERDMAEVTLTGEPPRVAGWTAVARVTWDPYAGPLTRSFDGRDRPNPASPYCEHCRSDRARGVTYLVADQAGDEKQVGTSCVKDYTGLEPAAIDWYSDSDDKLDEPWPETPVVPETEWLLTVAAAAVRQHGWLSAAQGRASGRDSTARRVMLYLEGHREDSGIRGLLPEDRERARRVRDLVLRDDSAGEYPRNLRAVLTPDAVSMDNAPLAASALAMADRIEAERRERDAASVPPEPLPTGEGLDLEGLVIAVVPKEGFDGVTWKMTLLGRGWKVYATVPATLLDEVDDPEDLKGRRVSVRMNVEASHDDAAFGFGSRPRLGRLLD